MRRKRCKTKEYHLEKPSSYQKRDPKVDPNECPIRHSIASATEDQQTEAANNKDRKAPCSKKTKALDPERTPPPRLLRASRYVFGLVYTRAPSEKASNYSDLAQPYRRGHTYQKKRQQKTNTGT